MLHANGKNGHLPDIKTLLQGLTSLQWEHPSLWVWKNNSPQKAQIANSPLIRIAESLSRSVNIHQPFKQGPCEREGENHSLRNVHKKVCFIKNRAYTHKCDKTIRIQFNSPAPWWACWHQWNQGLFPTESICGLRVNKYSHLLWQISSRDNKKGNHRQINTSMWPTELPPI